MNSRWAIAVSFAALCLGISAGQPARAHDPAPATVRVGEPYRAGAVAYHDPGNAIWMLEEWRRSAPDEWTVDQYADHAGKFVRRTIRLSDTGTLRSDVESLNWIREPDDSALMRAKLDEARRLFNQNGNPETQ